MGDLTGKVAIITGAGRGLGREEALQLARQGARVVINDINLPDAVAAAQSAVEEIKGFGGEAIAVFGDCADSSDAYNLMTTTLKTFGDINVMVNNAGFCRDKTIFGMSDDEFDSVVRVHLRGHFVNMRNVTAYWRDKAKAGEEVYGRLVSTSSEAAIYGSAGQPNYAAAKAGIIAMTMGAAQLLIKYGITANVIMPRARTRMNDSGMLAEMFAKPAEGFDTFAPENVSPLVGYLASPMAERISGQVFVIWGKHVTVVGRPSTDTRFESQDAWSVENLHQQLGPHFEKLEPVTDGFIVPPA
jgi:3-oxoacyl-[acyl-carrier protein] reductase